MRHGIYGSGSGTRSGNCRFHGSFFLIALSPVKEVFLTWLGREFAFASSGNRKEYGSCLRSGAKPESPYSLILMLAL